MIRDKRKRNVRTLKIKEIGAILELENSLVGQLLSIVKRKKFTRYEKYIMLLCNSKTAAKCSNILLKKVAREQDPNKVLLAISLLAASYTYDLYKEANIEEGIFLDTMKCFPRFIQETYAKTGEITYDRFFWTWRQLSMQLYRLGTLEYEVLASPAKVRDYLSSNQTRVLSVHIPSDAILTNENIHDSLEQAKEFFKNKDSFYCESWLLSPKLNELLTSDSRIKCFYDKFEIIGTEEGNNSCYEWLFKVPGTTPIELLPEDTSLCVKVKNHLLEGGSIGTGYGIIRA